MSSCTCRARTQIANRTEIMNSVFLTHCCYIVQNSDHRNFTDAEKQLAKGVETQGGWNPTWSVIFHTSVHRPMFLDNKNNLTLRQFWQSQGKKKEQKQRDALVYNSRPFNNGYPLDTTKLLVIKSNNDSISSHKGKMVETGWQGVMEIYNVCEMKAWEEHSISPSFPYPFRNSAPNKENGSESVLC